jgi:hypothetical protein
MKKIGLSLWGVATVVIAAFVMVGTPGAAVASSASGGPGKTCNLWENTGSGLIQGTICCSRNPFVSAVNRGACPCSEAPDYCR